VVSSVMDTDGLWSLYVSNIHGLVVFNVGDIDG